MLSAKPIAALLFILCSGLADACDTFTISGRLADQGAGRDTWIGVFQYPLAERAEPVASAWVEAEFELMVPCAESVTLLALRKGAVPLARRISGSVPTAVELRFVPGLSLAGSVYSDENLPISGARITVTRIDEAEVRLPESLTTWRSSSDGAFVAGGLVLGTYRVVASADGHMPSELDVVVEEGRPSRIDVRLPRAFFIAGRVVDTSGTAAVGAEIHGESSIMDGGVTAETTATTDSDGVFRLGPLRKGQRILVSARADLWRSDAVYVAAPIEDLVLTLHQAVEIRGSVSNALTGQLLDDFALKAYGPEVRSFAFRDAEGEFSAAVFWQTHYIVISAPGFVSWHMPIDFGSGGGEYDLGEVALALERVATGRVFDAALGLPVQGASVQRWFDESDFRNRLALDPASRVAPVATTDEDGRFRLSGLPGGDVLLKANPPGFSPEAVVELPAGTDHIDIETTPRSKSLTSGETRATSTGAYAIDGLDDGEYVVRVRGRSFGVELSGDTFYDIELGPLAVSGVVTAEGPVLGALVTVTPTSAEAGLWGSDRADSRGSFRIDGLDEGEYTVRVSHPDHGEVSRIVYLGSAIENFDVYLPLSPTPDG